MLLIAAALNIALDCRSIHDCSLASTPEIATAWAVKSTLYPLTTKSPLERLSNVALPEVYALSTFRSESTPSVSNPEAVISKVASVKAPSVFRLMLPPGSAVRVSAPLPPSVTVTPVRLLASIAVFNAAAFAAAVPLTASHAICTPFISKLVPLLVPVPVAAVTAKSILPEPAVVWSNSS